MDEKELDWQGSSYKDLLEMPEQVRKTFGHALGLAQNGLRYSDDKTLTGFKPASIEILEDYDGDTYRAVYTAHYDDVVYVLHCFKKKSTQGRSLPKADKETIEKRLTEVRRIEAEKANARKETMNEGHKTPAGKSVLDELGLDAIFVAKSKLAIRILKTVKELGLTQREAARRMPITQPRLSMIARGKLDDISQEKLEECLRALGHDVEIRVGPRHRGIGKLRVQEAA